MGVHWALFVGVLADLLVVAKCWQLSPGFGAAMGVSWLVAATGVGVMAGGKSKLGSRLVIGGSLVFVPLGLIAVWGAAKTLSAVEARAFRGATGGATGTALMFAPPKEFYSRHAKRFLVAGAATLGLGVVGFLTLPDAPLSPFAACVVPLVMGYALKSIPIVRIVDDRIEIKPGPFATKKIVAFGEIERVVTSDRRTVELFTARGKIVIPTFVLDEFERREIIERLGGPG